MAGIRHLLGLARRRADSGRAHRSGQDGHHGGHQCAARAQGRADRAGDHARLSRRAAHRLPEPSAPVRPPHRAARAAVLAGWSKSTSGSAPTATCCGRSTKRPRAPRCRRSTTRACARWRSCFMHGYRFTEHEAAAGAHRRATIGFTQISVSHQVSPMMKLVARGDTTVVDAYLSPILRRYVDQVAGQMPGVNLQFMQSNGGLTDARAFQGKDSILSGPAGGIVGMVRASQLAGFDARDRLRHGRHLDRRVAFFGRVRARVRDPGGRRAHARADDEHPHGGRRRRLDPALRRQPLPGRARTAPAPIRGRPATGAAARWRSPTATSCSARSSRRISRACSAADGRQALDHRYGFARNSTNMAHRIGAGDRQHAGAGAGGRRLHPHRGRQHGQRDQADLGAARARRHRLHADQLRRRRRPARLPGGRRAGHEDRVRAHAGRRAVGLRHGPGRPDARCARRRSNCGWPRARRTRWRSGSTSLATACAQRAAGAGRGGRAHHAGAARAPALRRHRLGHHRAVRRCGGACRRSSRPPTRSASRS